MNREIFTPLLGFSIGRQVKQAMYFSRRRMDMILSTPVSPSVRVLLSS
jgi:hypothetical protein